MGLFNTIRLLVGEWLIGLAFRIMPDCELKNMTARFLAKYSKKAIETINEY